MINHICLSNLALAGEILIFVSLVNLAILKFLVFHLHEFLASNAPITADVLVVEGWLPDYAIEAAMHEFRNGSYHQLITVGGSIQRGSYLCKYKTFAELAAATLNKMGVDSKQLLAVSYNSMTANRTYDSATELKEWLILTNTQVSSLNLFTLGTHSRRSWILFKKAFEPQIRVGIIAIKPSNYNPQKWWESSEGTRTVVSELIAYSYTRLFIVNLFRE